MSNMTDAALRRAMEVLREVLEQSYGGGAGGGDNHAAWPASTSIKENWNKIQLLDVYLSQVCIKKEPYKEGAQMWFVGAGTFRKYTVLPSGEVDTVYVDLESLIGKKADKPKVWTEGPFTGIKAGDTILVGGTIQQTVVFVQDGYFYVWNGHGFTSCPVTADNIGSYEGFFFARDWSESELKAKPLETLLQVSVGDRVNRLPVVRISQNGNGSIKTRVEVSNGTEGFFYYELDNNMALYKARVSWSQSMLTTVSVTI